MEKQDGWIHRHRVRYQETDQMGVVYHVNYLNWFEVGRTEWIRSLGVAYADLERQGLLLPVTDIQIKYVQPARYDEWVNIHVRLSDFTRLRIGFEYEVRRERDEELLVMGTSRHVWMNRSWKPVRIDRDAPELYGLILRHYTV